MKKFFLAFCTIVMVSSISKAQTANELMSSLSLRQKVAQLFVPAVGSSDEPGIMERYESYVEEGIGGVIINDGNLLPTVIRLNALQAKSKIPLLVSIDGEWGASMRFPQFPYFPRQMQLGALRDEELVYQMGHAVGRELKMIHVGANYAPVVDINVDPLNPVINTRSFGEDKEKVAAYGWAYARGMQEEGIAACLKHFPGHGDTKVDSHRGLPVLDFSRSRLDSLELYPFRYGIDKGVQMVMVGHLNVPCLDPSGTPTSVSPLVVTKLLREELGFKGVIVTDGLGMAGVREFFNGDRKKVVLNAFKAGCDMLIFSGDVKGGIDTIVTAVQNGEIAQAFLDSAVYRILSLKQSQGLLSPEYNNYVEPVGLLEAADSDSDKKLIAQISRKSLVLVHKSPKFKLLGKNSRKVAFLALGAGMEKRVIAMDEAAGYVNGELQNPNLPKKNMGGGPSAYGARRGVGASGAETLGDILNNEANADVFFLERGFTLDDLKAMRKQLKGYRTVVVGFHDTDSRPQNNYGIKDPEIYDYIGEWSSKQNLVGVYCGSPYALDVMPWYENFQAFVIAWADNKYNCTAAGEALTGRIPFEGVLPVRAGGKSVGYAAQ